MIKSYSVEQLDNLRQSGKILAGALAQVKKNIRAGISTLELDKIAEDFIISNNAAPSFKNYNGFPFSICTSVNEESIHGMPREDKILKEGDIISVDIGVRYNGMCTDAARTWPVGKTSDEAKSLIHATRQCFVQAIKGLKAKSKVGDIGERIQDFISQNTTFSIIQNFFGHGVGENVHEEPLIPNFRPGRKTKPIIREHVRKRLPLHSVIAIEPMINAGEKDVEVGPDGWTVTTVDGRLSAHYENTVIVLEDGVEVVTRESEEIDF